MSGRLLGSIADAAANGEAFALIFRPERPGAPCIEVYKGERRQYESFIDLPEPRGAGDDLLVMVPYAQLRERGYACIDDGERLQAIHVRQSERVPLDEAIAMLPDMPLQMSHGGFDIDDAAYEDIVRRVITDEIGRGEGANFVIKRRFIAQLEGYSAKMALAAFRRLLQQESGAYWTFLVHLGDRTFVGASPERHTSLEKGVVTMNPISGTYRYPPSGPTLSGVMDFLADTKEVDELYMVVDEELKMMAHFCPRGGTVDGPYLKEMSRLAHTEYYIQGRTTADMRVILRHTLFAPTVTGSPIENACRVIARHEHDGRGFYAGALALMGRDEDGVDLLDSAILIRTAEIDAAGTVGIGVGATIVRHSNPASEAEETRAKAKAVLTALGLGVPKGFASAPEVRAALDGRNQFIANFWLTGSDDRIRVDPALKGRRALVVDAEDAFTGMLAQQLSALGFDVTVRHCVDPSLMECDCDLVVLGPGPGDPRDLGNARIAGLRRTMTDLLSRRKAFLAVCLSHQILCQELGLELVQRAEPNQGVQREIDFFGDPEWVGFYNTFVAKCGASRFNARQGTEVEVSRDTSSDEVHALRGPRFASIQFHAESLLTRRGVDIIESSIKRVLEL